MALCIVGHLRVEAGHDLIGHINDRDGETLGKQVFGRLKADEAAADNHGLLRGVGL